MVETRPYGQLRFGHDHPSFPVNSRLTGREPDAGLIKSLGHYGVLTPLLVYEDDHGAFVIDGNRRLAGLNGIAKDKTPIPVSIFLGTLADALGASLATHEFVAPLHPLDRLEAFKRLVDAGVKETAIAKGFNLSARVVSQTLALSRVAPEVLTEIREDRLDLESASAFSIEPSHERQVEVLKSLAPHARYRHSIVRLLVGNSDDFSMELQFIGKDAAKAGGVEMVEDLFERSVLIRNPEALQPLIAAKIEREIAPAFLEAGWGSVLYPPTLPDRYHWGYGDPQYTDEERARLEELQGQWSAEAQEEKARIPHEAYMRLPPEAKATMSVFVTVRENGDYRVSLGRTPPAPAEEVTPSAAKPAERKEPSTHNWHTGNIIQQARESAHLALAARHPDDFLTALRDAFDPHEFFAQAPKAAAVAAAKEIDGEDGYKKAPKQREALVAHVARRALETGWLPQNLQARGYALLEPVAEAAE